MNLSEFKAWFEGFTDGIGKTPTEDQWKKIKARVKEINGETVSYPVYVDRYVRPYGGRLPNWYEVYCSATSSNMGSVTSSLSADKSDFNSCDAMFNLGKAEAKM